MSEDLTKKLSQFTPVHLDRDAILFAAGRASARPKRIWKWTTLVLLITQSLTIGWLLLRSNPQPNTPEPNPAPVTESATALPELPSVEPSPYSLIALAHNPDPVSADDYTPRFPSEPLRAFNRNYIP